MSKKNRDFRRSAVSNRIESYFPMNNSKLFISAICVLGLTLAAPLSTEAGRGAAVGWWRQSWWRRRSFRISTTGRKLCSRWLCSGIRVLCRVAILAPVIPGAILALVMLGVAILALEWGLMALVRLAGTSPALVRRLVIGAGAITGTAATTGTAALVIGEIRMANGDGGTGTGGVIPAIMWSSLAILAFPGGGVGAGARGPAVGYPYGYYGYGDPYYGGNGYPYYGYGNGYGAEYQYQPQYGSSSQSRVAELQRRLARAGYYNGSVDGILGPQTRRAIRAYEQQHGDVG